VPWKLAVAQAVALGWLGVSIWLSLPWVRELSAAVGIVPAVAVVALVAYVPGWLAFLAASLLLDRQPPVREAQPTVPVTVLIAARNEAERIEETIAYIARQDYQGPISVLVADNGSTDGTQAIAEAFGAASGLDVRCIVEPRPGKSHALNTGLAAVRTELVITLDADTLLHPRAIRQLVARLLSSPGDVRAVAGSVLVRNSRDNLWTRMQEWDYFLGIASVKRMQGLYQGTLVAQGGVQPVPHRRGAGRRRLARRHRRGHRADLAAHAAGRPRVLRALGGRLHRRPDPPGPLRAAAGPLGARHDRGAPQREALGPADVAAALPHGPRPADPGAGHGLRAGVAARPGAGGHGTVLIVGPYTVAVLPLTLLVNAILYRYQRRRVFNVLGLRVRRNALGFVAFVLTYQMLMSPVSVAGYVQELLGLRRRWK
jgi:poly-beta-1,6-N-acetyl-D-glucosamine synthase